MEFSQEAFLAFLLAAKRVPQVAQGDDATVPALLPGAPQLEYRDGAFLYHDGYIGGAYFVGPETVYYEDVPIWAMSYAGGVAPTITADAEIAAIYAFLRAALLQVTPERPYRGPQTFQEGPYTYADDSAGGLHAFWGRETISQDNRTIYALRYSGGFLR